MRPVHHTNVYREVIQSEAKHRKDQLWLEAEWKEELKFQMPTKEWVPPEKVAKVILESDADALVDVDEGLADEVPETAGNGGLNEGDPNSLENPESDIMLQVAQHKFMYT